MQENLKMFCKHLADMFHFLYQFLSLGHDEVNEIMCFGLIYSKLNQLYSENNCVKTNFEFTIQAVISVSVCILIKTWCNNGSSEVLQQPEVVR